MPADETSYRKERMEALSRALKTMKKDDGDALPSGSYTLVDGDLERSGPTERLDRYHGSTRPSGTSISDFKLKRFPDEGRKALGQLPAVYTTDDRQAAYMYAQGMSMDFDTPEGSEHQLYHLTVTPSEVVDLGTCENDKAVRRMAKLGADVIDCPDYHEQPESVVLKPNIVHVRKAVNVDTGRSIPIKPFKAAAVNRRKGRGGREQSANRRK